MVKRRFNELFSLYRNERFIQRKVSFNVRDVLPNLVFNRRTGFFKVMNASQKTFSLTFLNYCRNFSFPINWHDKELERGTRLWKLNLHYMEYLEEVDDEWFKLLINDWIIQNAPYKKDYYMDSWNAYALSIRVVVWMQQLSFRRNSLDKSFFDDACESVIKQLLFLENNIEKDILGNHIIKNIKALLWAGRFFEKEDRAERWRALGMKLLAKEVGEQILNDGMHFERSPSYHNQVLADLFECYQVLPDGPLKKHLRNTLDRMGHVTQLLKHPDGLPALFNDGGLSMSYKPDLLLKILSTHIGFKGRAQQEIDLPAAGYYGFTQKNNYLLFDAGKIAPDYLPAHGHGDIFSFEWSINGCRIFIDKGVYEYNSGPRRIASRSTRSHNTVNIAQKDQCEFWGAFRVAERAKINIIEKRFTKNGFLVCASHDGYKRLEGKPVHSRTFSFDGQNLDITDSIENGSKQKAEACFLLHPDVLVSRKQTKLILVKDTVKVEFISSRQIEVVDSVWYPNFGVEESCKQIVVDLGTVPCGAKHKIRQI